MSTIVGAAVLLSLGQLSLMCKTSCPASEDQEMWSVSRVKFGSKVDSVFDKISCIRNAPANAIVETAQIRALSGSAKELVLIKLLNNNIAFKVIGSLPSQFLCL
jgi:hypothetical protein